MTQAEHIRAATHAIGDGDDDLAAEHLRLAFAPTLEIHIPDPVVPAHSEPPPLRLCPGPDCPGLAVGEAHSANCYRIVTDKELGGRR